MKRTKTPIKSPEKITVIKTPNKEKQKINVDFFEKYLSKYSLLFLVSLIVLIGLVAFKDYLFTEKLFFFKGIGSDSINQDLPELISRIHYLGNSYSEKWSFYQGMGNAYFRNIPIEPLGFFSYLVSQAGVAIFGVEFAVYGRFIIMFVFHFILSGIFFYYYLRTISIDKYASVIGALFAVFSGYMVLGSSWGFAGQVFGGIFLLFAFEQLFVKKRWYFFPFAVIYISGNPFSLYIYSFFLLTYSLFRYFGSSDNKFTGYLILSGKMIALGIVGLLMNSVNFWRSFSIMFFSPRVVGNSSLANVLQSGNTGTDYTSHNASSILRFFSNDILGSGIEYRGWQNYFESPAFYIGIFSLLLFTQIFTHIKKREALVYGIFAAFWLASVFIPPIRYAILLYTGDYYRYGFDFFIPFILLFASIYSLNKLDSGFKINLYTLSATVVFLLVLIYYPYKSISSDSIDNNIRLIITFLILIYSILIYLFSVENYKNVSKIVLLIVVILELTYFSYKSYEKRNPLTKKEYIENMGGYKDGTPQAVNYIQSIETSKFYRTTKDYQSGIAMHGSLNDAMAQGYYGTAQYSSFSQINYVRFLEETGIIPKGDETSTRWITGLRPYPLLLTFANVKYQLSKNENPEFTRLGFKLIKKQNGITILKNQYALPFGYTYDKYIDFEDFISLKKYKINEFSLKNIELELKRRISPQKINEMFAVVQPIVNKEFNSDIDFYSALKAVLSVEDFNAFKFTFIRNSTQNFRNQVALLMCFVNENGDDFIDTLGLKKLNVKDTSVFVDAQYFNFDIYQKSVNELKTDTFKIESFQQSRITGSISLKTKKMLFFTIPYDKSWKIKVNGKEEDLKRVNIGFTGIKLNKGNYKIELYYQPAFLKPSIIITIIANLLFWIVLIFWIIRKKKSN